MCGIVGAVGLPDADAIVVNGLRSLEYRGYDSAGIAWPEEGGGLRIVRAAGRVSELEERLAGCAPAGTDIAMGRSPSGIRKSNFSRERLTADVADWKMYMKGIDASLRV